MVDNNSLTKDNEYLTADNVELTDENFSLASSLNFWKTTGTLSLGGLIGFAIYYILDAIDNYIENTN